MATNNKRDMTSINGDVTSNDELMNLSESNNECEEFEWV